MKIQLPKKALVTGGAGFLGTHLCERLLKDGYEVTCLDNLFTGMKSHIEPLLSNSRFTFVQHDITQPYRGQFDEIYNLACPASPPHYQKNPLETLWTSIDGMRNVLNLARDTGAKVLHASTSEVYGDPLVHPQVESYWGNVNTIGIRSCYDEGKRVAETMATEYRRCHGVDVRMVRIFNTYGPYMHPQDGRVITNFVMQALHNENITIYGDGSQTRSFQYCDDLINAMRLYMELPRETVDGFFTGKEKVEKVGGISPDRRESRSELNAGCGQRTVYYPPVPVINTGNPGEFTMLELADLTLKLVNESNLHLHLPLSTSQIVYHDLPGDDPKKRKPDITLAKELLGWEPKIPLAEGLVKTIEYFRQF